MDCHAERSEESSWPMPNRADVVAMDFSLRSEWQSVKAEFADGLENAKEPRDFYPPAPDFLAQRQKMNYCLLSFHCC
jgi:hypothetical protein